MKALLLYSLMMIFVGSSGSQMTVQQSTNRRISKSMLRYFFFLSVSINRFLFTIALAPPDESSKSQYVSLSLLIELG
jgi:hypothetical protein